MIARVPRKILFIINILFISNIYEHVKQKDRKVLKKLTQIQFEILLHQQ